MKKGFFGDMLLKILSVMLAASLWFFVTYRGQSETSFDVPIAFKNVPRGLEILRGSVRSVTLSVRGHERLLKGLRPVDTGVVIDLSNAKKGESVYYIDKGDVVVPRTVEILRIEPTSIKVTLDESVSKTTPVKASIVGVPEKGYFISSVEVSPSTVWVEGAKTELARVAFLRTEPVDVTGLDSPITQNVRLNPNGKNIRTKVSEVMLRIVIRKSGK